MKGARGAVARLTAVESSSGTVGTRSRQFFMTSGRLRAGVEDDTAEHERTERMHGQFEFRDDPEVAARVMQTG